MQDSRIPPKPPISPIICCWLILIRCPMSLFCCRSLGSRSGSRSWGRRSLIPAVVALGLLPDLWNPSAPAVAQTDSPDRPPSLTPSVDRPRPNLTGEQWPGSRRGGTVPDRACFPPASHSGADPEDLALADLVALMPSSNLGQTLEPYPRLFWYLPPTTARYAEFSLYTANANLATDQLLYRTRFRLTGEGGIASLKLSSETGAAPLNPDQPYLWRLKVYCDSDDRTRDPGQLLIDDGRSAGVPSPKRVIQGVVQRLVPSPHLLHQLKDSEADAVQVYLDSALWWDAVAVVAADYCGAVAGGDRPTFDRRWRQLLRTIDLEPLASQPLLTTCPSLDSSP